MTKQPLSGLDQKGLEELRAEEIDHRKEIELIAGSDDPHWTLTLAAEDERHFKRLVKIIGTFRRRHPSEDAPAPGD